MRKKSFSSYQWVLPLAAGLGAVWVLNKRRMGLSGKVVLVTGASRGLGLAIAQEFAKRGARLAICSRSVQEIEAAALEFDAETEVLPLACDVTQQKEVDDTVRHVVNYYGTIDVLINNAGVIQVAPVGKTVVEDYEEAMKTHFWGPLYTTLAALPTMQRRGSGRIVNIASLGGKISLPHLLAYSASKFALVYASK